VHALLLAVCLAAAPRGPLAPRQASAVVFIRSPGQALADVRAFLTRAGALAPVLAPEELGRSLGFALGADLLDPVSLGEAGVDLSAPLTVSDGPDGRVVCLTGGKATVARLDQRLAKVGALSTRGFGGARLVGAQVGERWRSGYAAKGSHVCFASGADPLAALRSAVDAMNGAGLAGTKGWALASQGVDGPVVVLVRGGELSAALALRPSASGLAVSGRWLGPAMLARPRGSHELAALSVDAPLVTTANLAPAAFADPPRGPVASMLLALARGACPRCDALIARSLWDGLKTRLAGPVGLVVAGVDPSAAREPMGDYFLAKHVYLAELKDESGAAAALKAAVERLREAGVAVREEERPGAGLGEGCHFAVPVKARSILLGVSAGVLYVANEAGVRDLVLAALEKGPARPMAHAAQLALDGPRAVAALRSISLLDVGRSPELGLLFAASIEAGALLKAAGAIPGHADPDPAGGLFEIELNLRP
jgi:hypothetical protein